MSVSRWKMNRLGLVDFWCYEDDEFDFENGHMLLRGSNGSGKPVTMQSMIPLLLDGNRSSERLDPFGTRSRKMDTYLIDENSERDERIGYLYLEFKRLARDVYKTIGMGIRARKNKPLETWYFVIEDNRRVNIDFKLMENHFTLTKKQLENVLGNQVISSQKEYMQKVNDSLFGFENIDDYKDAIDLLLQLRSPKLSNSLSPLKINEILAQSLQPLSEDDLRPMSEAITSMDNLQDDLQNLNTSYDAAKRINQAYDVYNKVILVDKWQKFNRENEQQNRIIKEIKDKEVNLNKIEIEYHQLQEEYQESYDKLLLSMGAKPIKPNIPGINSNKVFTLRNIPDTYAIKEYVDTHKPKHAIVVGGGFIGIEMAENLHSTGINVTIVEMANQVISPIDYEMACEIHQHLISKGINLVLETELQAINEAGNKLTVTLNNQTVDTDMVIMAIGVVPETKIVKNTEIATNSRGAIIVNDKMETSIKDIYAVGDAIEIKNFVTNKASYVPLAGPANKQGRIAADNICGFDRHYQGTQGSSILKVFDLTVASSGINEKTARELNLNYDKVYTYSANHAGYYPGAVNMSIKVLFDKCA